MLPTTGQLSLFAIFKEIHGREPNVGERVSFHELVAASNLTDKSFPCPFSRFRGYSTAGSPYVFGWGAPTNPAAFTDTTTITIPSSGASGIQSKELNSYYNNTASPLVPVLQGTIPSWVTGYAYIYDYIASWKYVFNVAINSSGVTRSFTINYVQPNSSKIATLTLIQYG